MSPWPMAVSAKAGAGTESGEFAWMDLLEKRDGKWVVLRSSGAKVWADSPKEQSQGPTVVETIKQLERDMGDAMVAANLDKLNQILADDWAMIERSGKIVTKGGLTTSVFFVPAPPFR